VPGITSDDFVIGFLDCFPKFCDWFPYFIGSQNFVIGFLNQMKICEYWSLPALCIRVLYVLAGAGASTCQHLTKPNGKIQSITIAS
jgi:hypothetical protein